MPKSETVEYEGLRRWMRFVNALQMYHLITPTVRFTKDCRKSLQWNKKSDDCRAKTKRDWSTPYPVQSMVESALSECITSPRASDNEIDPQEYDGIKV